MIKVTLSVIKDVAVAARRYGLRYPLPPHISLLNMTQRIRNSIIEIDSFISAIKARSARRYSSAPA